MEGDELGKPTPLQLYEIIRSKYTHEDLWVQQRVGWLLTANGFLFAGYGALLGVGYSEALSEAALQGLKIISSVGLVLPVLVGLGGYGAHFAKKGAKREWTRLVSDEVRQYFPDIDAAARGKWLGSSTSGVLCTLLVLVWLVILVRTL